MNALDALGNPVRRALLERLASGPLSVHELAEPFDISRPAISRHLRLLTEAGLVEPTRDGRENLYQLQPQGFDNARQWLDSFWSDALTRFKLVAENLENP